MDSLTDQLNALVNTELTAKTSWNSVSGGLDKVSASSMGFAWGSGGGKLWICQLPCSGDWKQVNVPGLSSITDITTDDTNVYVLFQTVQPRLKLGIKLASNVDEWIIVDVPTGITKIVSTSSYVWGQSGIQKWKLPKPGTTGNWIAVSDPQNIHITSASSRTLYGIDASGIALKTDESLQSGWTAVPEFIGDRITSLIGDADQTAVYGIDTTNKVKRCGSGKCDPVDTQGYIPQNLTVEPITKQLWMTSTTPSDSGNIFNKFDSNDYSSILQSVHPLEQQRDDIVISAESEYKQNTAATMLFRQLQTIKSILSRTFGISPVAKKLYDNATTQSGNVANDIVQQIQQLEQSTPILKNILMVLLAAICVYLFGSVLGWISHVLALVVLVGGTIYFLRNK